jgi:Xaa-Pro aminopeptidase
LQDDIFIRSAIATVSIAVGVAAVHRLWFMRQVRDVEKDAKEEELPAVPSVADDSDAELWEEEEPDASTFVKDSGSHWENVHIDALIAARFQSSEDRDMYAAMPSAKLSIVCVLTLCNMLAAIDKAIMLKSTEELMKARAAYADDAAAYVSSPMFICSSPRIHTRFQSGALS